MMDTPGRIPEGRFESLTVILFIPRFCWGFQGISGSSAGIGGSFPALSVADPAGYLVERNLLGFDAPGSARAGIVEADGAGVEVG